MAKKALDTVLRSLRRAVRSAPYVAAIGGLLFYAPTFRVIAAGPQPPDAVATSSKQSVTTRLNCPTVLAKATRLVTITTRRLSDASATAGLYRRERPGDPWQADGATFETTVGRKGLAWSFAQKHLGRPGELKKKEGDTRTPAGVFAAGAPFGFKASSLKNYIRLRSGVVCIDDPRSKSYSKILKDGAPAGMSHEKMWRISLYKHGLVVRTPVNATVRSGSCIFLHVWRMPGRPTVGCVAFASSEMKRIQLALDGQPAAVSILPADAQNRLSVCGLPRA